MKCLLCGNSSVDLSLSVRTEDIKHLYEMTFMVDTSREFKGTDELYLYRCKKCDLIFFYPSVTGSEEFYEELQSIPWYYLEEKDEYGFGAEYINDFDKVLEIGCGKGVFSEKIRSRDYTGLEFSMRAKRMAEERGIKVLNESIDIHAKSNPQAYDVVCFFQVLEHVSNVNVFLKSSLECLKPGGLLIVSVPSADSFVSSIVNNIFNMPPHHVTWWTDKSLESIASFFNLEIVAMKHEALSSRHMGWYAQSKLFNMVSKLLKRQPKLIDTSLNGRVLNKLAYYTGRVYAASLSKRALLPKGHSVTVVYSKNG